MTDTPIRSMDDFRRRYTPLAACACGRPAMVTLVEDRSVWDERGKIVGESRVTPLCGVCREQYVAFRRDDGLYGG